MSSDISVLIPCRDRYQSLSHCLQSLREHADDPSSYRIAIRTDEDVYDRTFWKHLLRDEQQPLVLSGEQRYGWKSNHTFFNELAKASRADWLFVFNDDAIMDTRGWDTIIRGGERPVLGTHMLLLGKDQPHCWSRGGFLFSNAFPVVHRRWVHALGVVARHPHVDNYVEYLARHANPAIDLMQPTAIRVRHQPVASQGRGLSWWQDFTTSPLVDVIKQDSRKLREEFPEGKV